MFEDCRESMAYEEEEWIQEEVKLSYLDWFQNFPNIFSLT